MLDSEFLQDFKYVISLLLRFVELPNIGRPTLFDQQSNERNPLSNWTQCVAKIQKSETCLRIPKPMATAK